MNILLLACVFLPLLGFIWISLTPQDREHRIAGISLWITRILGAAVLGLLAFWAASGFARHEYSWLTLYEHDDYRFPILFFLDRVGAAYLFVIWAVFSVIVKYCRVYLHREAGYKRFFQVLFGFAFGLNLIVLAGSIDMLFAGWEIVGISSFLLIAFYRHRPQPIRNALRAYTIYRFCDVGLLLGTWMSHWLFHDSSHFSQLLVMFDTHSIPPAGYAALSLLSWLIILAASGKSAQFPFCFWLPRAMEGPTPSSAIFYGALSIHLGVFLLLRTGPIWLYNLLPRLIVFSIGVLTIFVATVAEKAQSNIKGQVAYASIAQVGFMFVELAFGLEALVLLHFMGNAFLRCYQLLVSPSIVAHLLRVEGNVSGDFYIKNDDRLAFLPESIRDALPSVLQNSLYVFALQEGFLEWMVRRILWDPLKHAGQQINDTRGWIKFSGVVLLAIVTTIGLFEIERGGLYVAMPVSVAMTIASLSAFSTRNHPFWVWHAVGLSEVLAGVSVLLLAPEAKPDVLLFFSGVFPSWMLGVMALKVLLRNENWDAAPFAYRAFAEKRPGWSKVLFLSFLGLAGFPITPAFLGEDLLLSHASSQHPWFALPIVVSFVINGIAVARTYLRLCMGRPVELVASRSPASTVRADTIFMRQ